MTNRINVHVQGAQAMAALFPLGKYLKKSSLSQNLLELLYFRVSQINGCGFCLDMHSKELRAAGETEQRLYLIAAWREAPVYTPQERAALAWAEAVTVLKDSHVPDSVYEEVSAQFTENEVIDLTLAIATINTYNRINIAFGAPVGAYQIGQYA
jgi:AhpD family alkylhydroperoxidase